MLYAPAPLPPSHGPNVGVTDSLDEAKGGVPSGAAGVSAFAEAMRAHGFSNRELEMMFKENPAKALGLPVTPENRI